MELKDYLPSEKLIIHRRRMKLIDWVKGPPEEGLQARATVIEQWPLVKEGKVPSIVSIELVAQTVAALSTWRRGEGAKPRLGLLVGIKEAEFFKADVPVGTELLVHVKELYHIGDYAVFEGTVKSDSDFLCKMVIQVMEPEKEFLVTFRSRPKSNYGGAGETN